MDPLNLILLIVVVLIGMKLRSILGFRDEDEKPGSRADAYRLNRDAFETKQKTKAPAPIEELEEDAPADGLQEAGAALEGQPAAPSPSADGEALEETSGRGLAYLRSVEPDFDEAGFIDGARRAYEMILTAFADGDISGVKAFLGTDVASGFEGAIEARQEQGQQLITRILRLDRPVLDDARFENGKVQLDVRFRAELISFTASLEEMIDEAALPAPNTALDIWTFERAQGASDPSWALVATQSA